MKVTYNWLKDFVNIKIRPDELAHKLTMAGLEVTSLEKKEDDWVFEIEITSNRPDWLSVMGVAREVAAITKTRFYGYSMDQLAGSIGRKAGRKDGTFTIEIEDRKDCPLYTAAVIRGVDVRPSAAWMQKRLLSVGVRPVNNVVDITNYLLLETGEPLHAFDLDKISMEPEIIVRRAKKGETITTIDAKERPLDDGILVIADNKRPIAVAGVIGGKDTEVGETTKNILLEAAKFSPLLIRKERMKLGISTESSYRFERDIDIESVWPSSQRAQCLLKELCGGEITSFKGSPKIAAVRKKKSIYLRNSRVERILGVALPVQKVKNIMLSLGLEAKKAKGGLTVKIPNFRRDLNKEVDLIEEACRIYGYDRIPTTIPAVITQAQAFGDFELSMYAREILTGQGLDEAISLSLISSAALEKSGFSKTDGIAIANPLSQEMECLRPTLIPSLLSCLAYNLNRKQEPVQLFELAKIFNPPNKESAVLGIVLCGTMSSLGPEGRRQETLSIHHLKGVIEVLLERLGIREYSFTAKADDIFEQGSSFSLEISGKRAAVLGKIKKKTAEAFDIKNRDIFSAEVYFEKLKPLIDLKKKFTPLPLYPAVTRDISLIVKSGVPVADITGIILRKGEPYIKNVAVIDTYSGKHIPEGFKGLTLSCTYQSDERTLQDEEVNKLQESVIAELNERIGAQIR